MALPTPPIINPGEPADADLSARLAAEDAAALAELDEPPVDIPDRAKIDLDKEEAAAVSPETVPAVPEVPVTEAPPTTPESKPESKPDADLDAALDEIQPKKNAHPNTHKGYEALKEVAKKEREKFRAAEKARKELEDKYSSLETEYKGKVITPELEIEIKELRELRRDFHIENDPEFREKYNTKLAELDNRSINILKSSGLTAGWEKFISDNGGVVVMYTSTKPMPEGVYSEQTQQQFIKDTLMPKLDPVQKDRLMRSISSGLDLRDDMSREIEQAKTQGSEHQKKRQLEIETKFNESITQARTSFGPRAQKMDYPIDATKEDRARIDKHNGRVKKAEEAIAEYIREGKNPSKLGRALAEAAHSQILLEELADKDVELEAQKKISSDLREKLDKIKGSGSTGRPSAAPAPGPAKPEPGKPMSDEQAFAEWEKGK